MDFFGLAVEELGTGRIVGVVFTALLMSLQSAPMFLSCDSAFWTCYTAGPGKAGFDYKLADGKKIGEVPP